MYKAEIGHTIEAKRIQKSRCFLNHVVAPVVNTWENACEVVIRFNDTRTYQRIYYNEWDVKFLHESKEEEYA